MNELDTAVREALALDAQRAPDAPSTWSEPNLETAPLRRHPVRWVTVAAGSVIVVGLAAVVALGTSPSSAPGSTTPIAVTDSTTPTADAETAPARARAEAELARLKAVEAERAARDAQQELQASEAERAAREAHPGRVFEVLVPSGLTVEQVGELLAATIETVNPEEFVRAAEESATSSDFAPDSVDSAEGLLAPGSYTITANDTDADIAELMIAGMNDLGRAADIEVDGAALLRSPYEILTIASIIEREATISGDLYGISRVIHNRLFFTASDPEEPLPLQIDSTVLYGRDRLGIDPNTPFIELRSIPSDWNTYLLAGLPRTPITNPGAAAVDAALHPRPNPSPSDPLCIDLPAPDECSLFFFVIGDDDGSMNFAATAEQHSANVERAIELGLLDRRPQR